MYADDYNVLIIDYFYVPPSLKIWCRMKDAFSTPFLSFLSHPFLTFPPFLYWLFLPIPFHIATIQWRDLITNFFTLQEFVCQGAFGNREEICSHLFPNPFRAFSVRIIAKDYDTEKKPKWRIEFGGLDYLEGVFDNLQIYLLS